MQFEAPDVLCIAENDIKTIYCRIIEWCDYGLVK